MAKTSNATTIAALALTAAGTEVHNSASDATPNATTISAVTPKADIARRIFAEGYAMNPVPARSVFINRYMAEAGLTKNGAATYHQNMKAKAGFVVSKKTTSASA